MKFLCDRCKTRYSIGDERVRGKILKIRCKNCANVITVREGMPDVDEPSVAAPRPKRSTTMAPEAASTTPAPRPPAALEEEWYVSIDGDQSGPFSLAEAQAWITAKAFDAELHCWSEGFDDWLPVDKVSHFRGLRKRPAPPPAAPLPRVDRSGPSRAPMAAAPPPSREGGEAIDRYQRAQLAEEEPKPLFAATMASLEKSAAQTDQRAVDRSLGLPPLRATPPGGHAIPTARPNGSASGPIIQGKAIIPPKPALPGPTRAQPLPSGRTGTAPGIVSTVPKTPSGGAAAIAAAFDASEPSEQPTQIEVPPIRTDGAPNDAFAKALSARAPAAAPVTPQRAPAPPSVDDDDDGADDGLSIGEVSRVVNLADLMKGRTPAQQRDGTGAVRRISAADVGRQTGAVARLTGPIPLVEPAALVGADGLPVPVEAPVEDAAAHAAAVAQARAHGRAMWILIGVAGVLLIGLVAAVGIIISRNSDEPTGGAIGGHGYAIDTTRPDDPTHAVGPGSAAVEPPANPFVPHPNVPKHPVVTPPPPPHPDVPPAEGDPLRAEEVEAMAAQHSIGSQRCYMRSQKGADAILIGDVKKIAVTILVDKVGTVNDVQLSDHGGDNLGKCLIASIKTWKFRASPNGITAKITMVFQSE